MDIIMSTAVLESNSKDDLVLLIKLAQKIGIKAKLLSQEEVEDICLAKAIESGKTGEYVNTDVLLANLRQ